MSGMMRKHRCQTCRWWYYSQCRRMPPQMVRRGDDIASAWPATSANDWCGEHKPEVIEPERLPRESILWTGKYLVRRGAKKQRAHYWNGSDTVCRMYSTGGMNQRKFSVCDDRGGRIICGVCQRNLGPKFNGGIDVQNEEKQMKYDTAGRLIDGWAR